MEKRPMPRSTPEAEGLSSRAILDYLKEIEDQRLAMHSVMIVRRRKIVFEGYYKPFDENFRHRLYSCSKSFVSVAIGLLASKGLISLDDRAMDYLKDFPGAGNMDPLLEQCTIRDLLKMASPWTKGANYSPADPNWLATFYTDEVSHVPGTVFSYCTSGTTVLCYIIKAVTGKDFLGVLRPVFDEIGISEDIFCVKSPDGIEWGGSGVCATPREFAKFADLVMHYGEYEGKQLLPRDYLIEATTKRIDNSAYATCVDNAQGYGYQFWMLRHGGFAFFGMGGQYAFCFPKEELLVVTTGYEELGMVGRMNVLTGLWRHIFPSLSDSPLPGDNAALDALNKYAEGMEFVHCAGETHSPAADKASGRTYIMRDNKMGMKKIRFDFDGDACTMYWENNTGAHTLKIGIGRNIKGEFPEIYSGVQLAVPAGKGYDCLTSAAWVMPDTLMIHCYVADVYHGQLRLACAFRDDSVTLLGIKHAEWFMDEYEGFASGFAGE